jgi:hypothetical protein
MASTDDIVCQYWQIMRVALHIILAKTDVKQFTAMII